MLVNKQVLDNVARAIELATKVGLTPDEIGELQAKALFLASAIRISHELEVKPLSILDILK